MDSIETGGAALAAGFLLLLLLLYRDPAAGLAAATVDMRSALYFLVLPVAGLLAGAYAYADGPYSAVLLFALGSYLGVVGLSLTLGSLLAPAPAGLILGVGLLIVALALAALAASVLRSAASVGFSIPRPPSN
jgi:hypothetical protein